MKALPFLIATAITGTPVIAEEPRQLDAHEHGVGQLDIAIDGQQIAMELHAPGADIVGFEYAAKSAKDLAAVDAAVAKLSAPLALFVLPEAAGCSIVEASAGLESEEEHEEHGDEHADDEHADEEGHTEFHAEYLLNCAEPSVITGIDFAYFGSFPNALEVEVQIIADTGATSFEVERDAPTLYLTGLF
ncbi:MAG: DUF2796 domain-containing protein [Ascidiaceihabitans sp.]|nr:DUF2796 domain-containing protein [Ascidiaceihabitans sp.]